MAAPRVGLVLGAGGPVGHAFHAGVLRALNRALGWDPRTAEIVVGTSAGAQVGALIRGGVSSEDLAARVEGRPMTPAGAEIAQHYIARQHLPRAEPANLPYRPSATRYLSAAMQKPSIIRPGQLVSALLPEGQHCAMAQADGLRKHFGVDWPRRPLWITAVQLDTGRAVAFGRAGDPTTDVGTAVVASGAVPALCAPVEIDGHRYVDGGVASPLHLDMLIPLELDVVVVSSPLCRIPPMRWILRREAQRLERTGTEVVRIQPGAEVADAMGWNPMDIRRSAAVSEAAFDETMRAVTQAAHGDPVLRLKTARGERSR